MLAVIDEIFPTLLKAHDRASKRCRDLSKKQKGIERHASLARQADYEAKKKGKTDGEPVVLAYWSNAECEEQQSDGEEPHDDGQMTNELDPTKLAEEAKLEMIRKFELQQLAARDFAESRPGANKKKSKENYSRKQPQVRRDSKVQACQTAMRSNLDTLPENSNDGKEVSAPLETMQRRVAQAESTRCREEAEEEMLQCEALRLEAEAALAALNSSCEEPTTSVETEDCLSDWVLL